MPQADCPKFYAWGFLAHLKCLGLALSELVYSATQLTGLIQNVISYVPV